MPDITIIGPHLKGFGALASSRGHKVRNFRSPKTALKAAPSSSLLVAEREQAESIQELLKVCKDVPKIVVSWNGSSKSKQRQWLRAPMSYPIHDPEDMELMLFAERVLKDIGKLENIVSLRNLIKEMKREIQFFEKMNRMLNSARDSNEILSLMMTHAIKLTSAEAWAILMIDDATGELVLEKSEGNVHRKKLRLKPGEGLSGWVVKKGKPLIVADVKKDKRFASQLEGFIKKDIRSVMCVPVRSKGSVRGVIEVINRSDENPFTREDLDVLMRLVGHTAIALERISLHQRLEELVITDDLTSLFNSRYLNRSIETEILRSKRYSSSVALIFMDLDYFKNINDNYGHLAGSKVLIEVAQILIDQLRSIDIVARYGGDEFVIVLPQTSLSNAMSIAERIRKEIERYVFLKEEGLNLKATASFGVAAYPESAHSQEELLRLADESMYNVKHRTRNGVYAII